MNKIIRLTESDLHNIVKEAVYRILKEDGLGGATSCAGVYDTPSSTGTYEGGKAQSKEVTDYPLGGVIRKGHNLGNPTKKKEKGIDMTPATDRSGGKNHSIAINYVGESAIHEAVEEGIGNWLKGAALGGMMAMSNPQAAQAQKYQYQENPYVNGVEQVNHPYSQKYDISYDNEESKSLIYDLLRNNAAYDSRWGKGITPEVLAKIQKYPKYDMKTPIEAFLKANKDLIKRCGGNVGGVESDVTFVYANGGYYLVPSDINML